MTPRRGTHENPFEIGEKVVLQDYPDAIGTVVERANPKLTSGYLVRFPDQDVPQWFKLEELQSLSGGTHTTCEPWVQTFSGVAFDLLNPTPDMVKLDDITQSLAHLCRFTGHVNSFYSVAQHSVFVSLLMESGRHTGERAIDDRWRSFHASRWGLLHDASEAYIGDLCRPMKILLPRYREVEERITRAIAERFDLPWPCPCSEELKQADNVMLSTERRDLLGTMPDDRDWEWLPDPMDNTITPLSPHEARSSFIARAFVVGIKD